MKFLLVLLAAALLATPAAAWWCGGHMLTAQVAYNNLNSDAQQFYENIAESLGNAGPFPESPDFTQLACWADDIKHNIGVMQGWHFIDIPYNPDNITIPDNTVDVENVEFVLDKFGYSLRNEKRMNDWELGFSLANYLHFFGDIHQPLHCANLFNAQFPQGDRGGNSFHVTFQGKSQPLHAVWDSVGGLYSDDSRPLNDSARQQYVTDANNLQQQYTFPSTATKLYNTTIIGAETHNLAITAAYAGVQPDDTLTSAYISNCQNVAQSQVTLGGLRLGNQLQYYYNKAHANGVADHMKKRYGKNKKLNKKH